MVSLWVCAALVALTAALTYFITLNRRGKPNFDELLKANVDAARANALHAAREEVLENIRPEIQYFVTTEKQFFVRRTRLIVRERLVYKHLPLMGWIEHSHLIEENMDTPQLEQFAKAAAHLLEAGAKNGALTIRRL